VVFYATRQRVRDQERLHFVYAEIATVLRLDFHSGSVSRLAESLKAVTLEVHVPAKDGQKALRYFHKFNLNDMLAANVIDMRE
jgi:hypothetical protein